eukprot:3370662-Rhodomonas_salina.1
MCHYQHKQNSEQFRPAYGPVFNQLALLIFDSAMYLPTTYERTYTVPYTVLASCSLPMHALCRGRARY